MVHYNFYVWFTTTFMPFFKVFQALLQGTFNVINYQSHKLPNCLPQVLSFVPSTVFRYKLNFKRSFIITSTLQMKIAMQLVVS